MTDIGAFTALVDSRYGPMLCNRRDLYVGKSFTHYGEFSGEEVDFLCQLVQPGMTIIDAGANIGALTVPLAKAVGIGGEVFAFEPQRLSFQMLAGNLALNELRNVRAYHAALGKTRGLINVPLLEPDADQNFGGVSLRLPWHSSEPVPSYSIDALKLSALHLLKADVEGMEPEVIEGAKNTIRLHTPVLYLEADREDRRKDLAAHLRDLEYVAFWHCPPLYRPNNYHQNNENVFGEIVSVNWLCVHRSQANGITVPRVEW